jgi:predicted phosphodiesterase
VSDIHGNLAALERALRVLHDAGMDRLVCLGDVVGYGPQPVECVQLLATHKPLAVAGNHEEMVLGRLPTTSASMAAKASLDWTREVLTDAARQVISMWPKTASAPGIVVTHGSPDAVDEYVRTAARAGQVLSAVSADDVEMQALLLGHTHESWAYSARHGTRLRAQAGTVRLDTSDRYVLNPGSVGQSRDRRAHVRCLTLDLAEQTATFHSVPYDAQATRDALRRRGLPPEWCHVVPPVQERTREVLRELLRRRPRQ